MSHRSSKAAFFLTASMLLAGCAVGTEGNLAESDAEVGSTSQAVAACVGDDVNYDYNAFAASLAVAVANELGRWDATADMEVRLGKVELSATGKLRCPTGCPNVSALLRLQDDAASAVPNHSPSIYRSKLVAWHQAEVLKLNELVKKMLYVDKGIYKFKAVHSGKYLAVDNASIYDNAAVEQRSSVPYAGADQWRVVLEGTKHRFINVRSGKCLAVSTEGNVDSALVQRTCSTALGQQFEFAVNGPNFSIRTPWAKALHVQNAALTEDARAYQYTWTGTAKHQQWALEPVGTGHISPTAVATAVYTFTARHSGKALGVDNGSMADGARIEQGSYFVSNDSFRWYVIRNANKYQIVNRRSGKCMGLETDTSTARITQQTCDWSVLGQIFEFATTGDGYVVPYTKFGRTLEVEAASTLEGAYVTQGASNWTSNRQYVLKPMIAGEPHSLTFAFTTSDAACGEYNYWYNILKPNKQSLDFAQDSYVQLIFAGGKQTATGADVNPFIAQQMSGDLVAIDPTAGLNEGGTTTSGSCSATCTKYSASNVAGNCCSCNGATKKFVRSTFSTSMYLCTGN